MTDKAEKDIESKELEQRVEEYFRTVTPEQLEKDCKDANIDFYSQIKTKVFS